MDKKKTKDKKGQGGQYRWTDTETEDRKVQGGFDRQTEKEKKRETKNRNSIRGRIGHEK